MGLFSSVIPLEPTILPIWHKVDHSDVTAVSPSLANIVAILSSMTPIEQPPKFSA
jgi:hypothetical protein